MRTRAVPSTRKARAAITSVVICPPVTAVSEGGVRAAPPAPGGVCEPELPSTLVVGVDVLELVADGGCEDVDVPEGLVDADGDVVWLGVVEGVSLGVTVGEGVELGVCDGVMQPLL